MFENCGSCEAAEQFVDIKLGAKYLLTLTSNYDRAEERKLLCSGVIYKISFYTLQQGGAIT